MRSSRRHGRRLRVTNCERQQAGIRSDNAASPPPKGLATQCVASSRTKRHVANRRVMQLAGSAHVVPHLNLLPVQVQRRHGLAAVPARAVVRQPLPHRRVGRRHLLDLKGMGGRRREGVGDASQTVDGGMHSPGMGPCPLCRQVGMTAPRCRSGAAKQPPARQQPHRQPFVFPCRPSGP